ncbi:MAG: alpha/beta fold hydrolase [Pseudomonadota bacterium]
MQKGSGDPPLLLLHGFAATSGCWQPVLDRLNDNRLVIAHDLPGHGKSADYSTSGRTAEAADAILDDMVSRDIDAAHFCGHSMGGAIACLIALKSPAHVRSLTLLAPGAFGPEINARLLRRFAIADREETLRPLFEQFYGWHAKVNEKALANLLEDRKRADAGEIYLRFAEKFLNAQRQYEISREALNQLNIPVKVVWGTQDRIVPTRQAHKLPGEFAVHVFEGVGHSIIDEIPDQIVRLLDGQTGN